MRPASPRCPSNRVNSTAVVNPHPQAPCPGWTQRRKPKRTALTQLLNEALASADEAVTVADEDGFIIEANDAVERVYRWPKKEIVGFHPLKFCPNLPKLGWDALSKSIWDTIQKNGSWTGLVINHDREGRCFPILLKTRRVVWERTTCVLSYARPFPQDAPFGLSPQESKVLTLLGQGRMPTEIAGALKITESTVRTHLTRIWKKAFKRELGYNLAELKCLSLRCLEAGWDSSMKLNEEILKNWVFRHSSG